MEKLEVADRALRTLAEIIEESPTKIVRDATIQRFEYSFEACWKALKAYLDEIEGIVCNSPKSCFRAAFRVGLLDEVASERTLQMTDARNLTSHTYIEEVARKVYEQTPEFTKLMRSLIESMQTRLEEAAPR